MTLGFTNLCVGLGGGSAATSGGAPPAVSSWVNEFSCLFDGVDDYMKTTSGPTLSGDATISFWVKIPSDPAGLEGLVVSPNHWNTGHNGNFSIRWDGRSAEAIRIESYDGQSGGAIQYNDVGWSYNAWHHILIALDYTDSSTSSIQLYFDGLPKEPSSGSESLSGRTFADASNGLYFASSVYAGGNLGSFLPGSLDEFAIWNSTLAANEVTEIYNSGNSRDLSSDYGNYVSSGNLKTWYRFGDTAGDNDDDSGGGGSGVVKNAVEDADNAVLYNDAAFEEDVPS